MKDPERLDEVNFHCRGCGERFLAPPGRVDDAPGDAFHPWKYFSACPKCDAEAGQVGWERALLKAWRNATGPRTPEGLAASAKNLAGHPTPEEALRTRFNAMKHGLSAQVATFFPAKPGRYAQCASCDVDREWCAQQPACVKRQELFLLTHAAFETRNPRHMTSLYAGMQAAVFALVNEILVTIAADGVKISSPEYYTDPTGRMVVATYIDQHGKRQTIHKIEAHPLFKPLAELLSRNNLSLADMGMTQKAIDDEEEALGRLKSQDDDRALISDFAHASRESMDKLAEMVQRAGAKRARDPILIEGGAGEGEPA